MSEERELSDEMKSANKLVEAINKLNEVNRDTVFRDELEKRWPSEEVLFDSFKNEWSAVPSQDNEGWVPDRGGFKAGWFCLERWLKQKLLEKR